jgi:hypothetical protein
MQEPQFRSIDGLSVRCADSGSSIVLGAIAG